ncbi:MAG: four helix bundle protein [Bacteroidia bacterium]|nr:four helix bundle protein [Bacteroidia bacterium]
MMVKRFEDLNSWKRSRHLCKDLFEIVQKRKFNKYGFLKEEILRSGIDIMKNISLGFSKGGEVVFEHHLQIALGSAFKLRNMNYMLMDMGLISKAELAQLNTQIKELISRVLGLIDYIGKNDMVSDRP